MKTPIKVSVTKLADFACRSGDLMPAGVNGPSAREGIRAHKKVQRQALEAAKKQHTDDCKDSNSLTSHPQVSSKTNEVTLKTEVTLKCHCTVDSLPVQLVGRVDILDQRKLRLTEIKTTLVPAEKLSEGQLALQWSQLYLYGFMFLTEANSAGDEIELELLHVNIRADNRDSDVRTVSFEELTAHAISALRLYVRWLQQVSHRRQLLTTSAATLPFPYREFRQGQRHMAAAVFRAARDGRTLMCEAPTGIGKTISALFPASKAFGDNDINQVVYLTAKVAGRLSAVKALNHLQDAGLQLNGVQIRAKQATCFCSNGRCERDERGRCPMTLGFFDRLPDARDELLKLGVIEGEQLDEIAWEHQLCPFELALQMLPWMHVVIADFNYVFDPLVRLPHFSEPRSDSVLLVDEAHNLVDRSRSMYSAQLSRVQCQSEATACRQSHPLVSKALSRVARALLAHHKNVDAEELVSEDIESGLTKAVISSVEIMVSSIGDTPPLPEGSAELLRDLFRYAAIAELFRENHRCISTITTFGKRKEVSVSLYCLDASEALSKQYRFFRSCVLFSATLRPTLFYRDTLGLPDETSQLLLSSPFDPHRSFHAVADWIDTRYRQRKNSLAALVSLIRTVSERRSGNYMVFFPSYAYLNLVFDAFVIAHPETETWRQTNSQTKAEQQQLLEHLNVPGHRIGFAVLGGVFGEGIDYAGDMLIGVVVISTGLPGLNTKTQLVAEHYRKHGHDGYDFAYRYPGFTRVLQTVGRLIRGETDAGVIVMVDDRFTQPFYSALYPDDWQLRKPTCEDDLTTGLTSFWNDLPKTS